MNPNLLQSLPDTEQGAMQRSAQLTVENNPGGEIDVTELELDEATPLGEVVEAAAHELNVVGTLADWGASKLAEESMDAPDDEFDAGLWYYDNEDRLKHLEGHFLRGYFDGTVNQQQAEIRVARAEKQLENLERLQNADGWGTALSLGVSLVDVTTLVPIAGIAGKGGMALKAAKGAASGTAAAALEEGTRAAVSPTPLNAQDVAANLAFQTIFGGALGGGAGYFARLNKHKPYYDPAEEGKHVELGKDPDAPLAESAPGQRMSEARPPDYETAEKMADEALVHRSAGAAAATVADNLPGTTSGLAGAFFRQAQRVAMAFTPSQRMVQWATPKMRASVSKILGSSARMDLRAKLGLDSGHSVVALKTQYESLIQGWAKRFQDRVYVINHELGGTRHKTLHSVQNTAGRVFNVFAPKSKQIVRGPGARFSLRELEELSLAHEDGFLDEALEKLRGDFGDEGLAVLRKHITELVDDKRKIHKIYEDELVRTGLMKEEDRLGDAYKMPRIYEVEEIRNRKNEFRAELLDILSTRPDDEFLASFDLDPASFEKLGKEPVVIKRERTVPGPDGKPKTETVDELVNEVDGRDMRAEILQEWNGHENHRVLTKLQAEVDTAEQLFSESKRSYMGSLWGLLRGDRALRDATFEEGRALVEKEHARLDKMRNAAENMRALRDAMVEASEAAKEKARLRQFMPEEPPSKYAKGLFNRILTERKVRDDNLNELLQADPSKGRQSKLRHQLGQLWQASMKELDEDVAAEIARLRERAPGQAQPPDNLKLARIQGRVDILSRKLAKLEKQLERDTERLIKTQSAYDSAKTARKAANDARKALTAAKKAAGEAKTWSKRELKKAKRNLERAATAKDLNGRIEDILENIQGGKVWAPAGQNGDAWSESGRVIKRKLPLSSVEERRLREKGFIRKDYLTTIEQGAAEVAAALAFARKFGAEAATSKGLSAAVKEGQDELDNFIEIRTREGADASELAHLRKQRKKWAEEMENLYLEVQGKLSTKYAPSSTARFWAYNAKALSYTVHAPLFLISSITDLATTATQIGFKGVVNPKNLRLMRNALSGAEGDEIAALLYASEIGVRQSKGSRYGDLDAINREVPSLGERGTMLNEASSRMTRVMAGLSESVNYINGMRLSNTHLKSLIMGATMQDLAKFVRDYDQVFAAAEKGDRKAGSRRARFATLDIGRDKAAVIRKYLDKHGTVDENGVVHYNLSKWWQEGTEEALDAYGSVAHALTQAADRGVPTPGVGDRPFFMHSVLGSIIFQFQSHGFLVLEKFLKPGLGRIATYQDMEAVMGFGSALSLGLLITAIKQKMNHGEVMVGDQLEDNPAKLAYEVVDRAGFLAFSSPYLNAAMTTLGIDGSDRYRNVNVAGQLLGPTFGKATDLTQLVHAMTSEDAPADRAYKLAQRVAPYGSLWRVFDNAIHD